MEQNAFLVKLFKEEGVSRNIRLSSRLILGSVFTVIGVVLLIYNNKTNYPPEWRVISLFLLLNLLVTGLLPKCRRDCLQSGLQQLS